MAKILVIDSREGTRVPFLRGILIRSLNEAGISFDDAYKLASTIRQQLGDTPEITTAELKHRVVEKLRAHYPAGVIAAYQNPGKLRERLVVRNRRDLVTPFSRAQHQQSLESSGVAREVAQGVTHAIYDLLAERGMHEVRSTEIAELTYDHLRHEIGEPQAYRYAVWLDYTHSGRPLILLIGGATGTGKSTIATEVAHRLGVVRTQSTDMLREVMRMMIPQRLLPVLHTSSFNAWQTLPHKRWETEDLDAQIADGYSSQMELLAVTCEAVIQRALRERVSLILEGVHIHPSLVQRILNPEDAIIVPIMLAVLKRDLLLARLSGRGTFAPARGARRYLASFDRIWRMQSFLLSEADRTAVPIIANDDREKAISLVMSTIIDALARDFSADPRDVFRSA